MLREKIRWRKLNKRERKAFRAEHGRKVKYELLETYCIHTTLNPAEFISHPFLHLRTDGLLIIYVGYMWDGASGPTIDTDTSMRAGLVHDALYELMRHRHLAYKHRKYADQLLRDIAIEDGMWRWRAWAWYRVVRMFSGYAAKPRR